MTKKKVNVTQFRTWEETQINATGLEIKIDLPTSVRYLKSVSINLDWDRFRETKLARQLEGMSAHPLLKSPHLLDMDVSPAIDIEVVWYFDVDVCQPESTNGENNYRIEEAGKWMAEVSRKVNKLLHKDDIITRWHIEVEGDDKGKFLTAINLISYFQYPVEEPASINQVHQFVDEKFQKLLLKVNRVVRIADETVEVPAA
ncbi:MAG: hypothetical protein WDZ29_00895 [Balneolaceae bacterium]